MIQQRRLIRLGGDQELEIAARLVFATHQGREDLVRCGRFREDLYYRINALEILLPPLRERPEDILWLAERFVVDFGRRSLMSNAR